MIQEKIELKKLITLILDSCYLMSLATIDATGPWVSDVVFVNDDELNIYWLSKPETRHSNSIRLNSKAAASITQSNKQGEQNIGLQLAGTAEELEGNQLEIAQKHLEKRKKNVAEAETILSKGQKWYRLTPTLIEVIYEPYWGFTKKKLNLTKSAQ